MDKLDQLIADKTAELEQTVRELAKFQARYDRLVIELEALKQAAKARPIPAGRLTREPLNTSRAKKQRGQQGGRQLGSISHPWRRALAILNEYNRPVSYSDIQEAAEMIGIRTQLPNVRERVRSMVENGLMKGDSETGFVVTPEAASRFELEELLKEIKNQKAA
jgi:hypothetical protein